MLLFSSKIRLLLNVCVIAYLAACKQGDYFSQQNDESTVNAANSGDRTLEEHAPEVFVFLKKWSDEAESQGFKSTVRENEDMSMPEIKKSLDEASSANQCFKVGNDQVRTLATFFEVSSVELGLNPSPAVLKQFKNLFKKPLFGNKNRVCDLSTLENSKVYSSRVWISGDDKFNLQLILVKKKKNR